MKEATEAPQTGEAESAGKKNRNRVWWIAAAVLIVIYAIPAVLTSTPRACASCHEMKPYYDSWQISSHRAAAPNCLYCHVKPGAVNMVVYRFAFYREILAAAFHWHLKPIGAVPPSTASCERSGCHSMNRQVSNSGNLNINHRLHVYQAGIPCVRCHPGAVHKGVGGRLLLPPMSICKQCHADKMNDCAYCHIGRTVPIVPNAHSGDSTQAPGAADPATQ